MITRLTLVRTESTDVFVNQGVEYALFKAVGEDEAVLYLWENRNTVVIGRNQNAYAEVNVDSLEGDGGKLARRLSGGGAVYHDEGNLNFTFIARSADFSKEVNSGIVLTALQKLGLDAELSGRNDVLVGGFKVSGNAYYKQDGKELHHGTMLVTLSSDKVAKYLTPPRRKLHAKGVKSVTGRVNCLSSFDSSVTADSFADALVESFREAYPGAEFSEKSVFSLGVAAITENVGKFADDEWRYGKKEDGTELSVFVAFRGENVEISAKIEDDKIVELDAYTDAMDENIADEIRAELVGKSIAVKDGQYAPEGSLIRALQEEWYEI